MTRNDLIDRLMSCNLSGALGVSPTKGELRQLSDSDLTNLLTIYDNIRNLQYRAQAIIIRIPVVA